MNQLKVDGRLLGTPVVTEEAFWNRYLLRVDSATNPEFWFEMYIEGVKLIEMLEMILAVRGQLHNGNLTALRSIRTLLSGSQVEE